MAQQEQRAISRKCRKIAVKYTKDKANCIMFYRMNAKCIHTRFGSIRSYMDYVMDLLNNPTKYAPSTKKKQFLSWFRHYNSNSRSDPLCDECIITFWSNSTIRELFESHTSKSGTKESMESTNLQEINRNCLVTVEISHLSHAFMINIHFVKYFLLSDIKLLSLFLKYLMRCCQMAPAASIALRS
eukprot:254808_1